LNCIWCDTNEVWTKGNPYSVNELLKIWEDNGVIEGFRNGQHLVFTGGSPMKQQKGIVELMKEFKAKYKFKPFCEIENECTLMPNALLVAAVDRWNNSPKLSNSMNVAENMYKPEILKILSDFNDSWFKFVIISEDDWKEIEEKFIKPKLIRKKQIILMPEGATREELQAHYQFAIDMAIKHGVRMTDRLQVTVWNKTTGV